MWNIHTNTHTNIHTYTRTHIHTHTHTHTHMHTYVHEHELTVENSSARNVRQHATVQAQSESDNPLRDDRHVGPEEMPSYSPTGSHVNNQLVTLPCNRRKIELRKWTSTSKGPMETDMAKCGQRTDMYIISQGCPQAARQTLHKMFRIQSKLKMCAS